MHACPRLARRADAPPLAGAEVAPAHHPALAGGVHPVGVAVIDPADEAVAAADVDPVLVDRPDAAAAGRPAPGAVVLEPAVGVVRLPRRDRDVVELGDGHVVEVV